MERVICLAIGYVLGLFQTGYIYGKMHNMDIRQHGSGNAGATNTMRVLGKKAGYTVFAGDFLKTILACLIARLIYPDNPNQDLFVLYAAFGAVLGHNFPFYLGFKGGKGIAASTGLLISLDFRIFAISGILWLISVGVTKYVSLGSILMLSSFFVLAVLFGSMGDYAIASENQMEFYALAFVIAAMAIWRHRANIKRLLNGTENKIGSKKK